MQKRSTFYCKILLLVLPLLLNSNIFAQKKAITFSERDDIEEKEGKSNVNIAIAWHNKANDPNLNFNQIVKYCDSLFAVPGNLDTGEDGEYMNYSRWKMFWAPRLDASTGKLHDFNKAAAEKIYNNPQQKTTTTGVNIGETNATDCGSAYSETQANIQTRSSGGTDNTYGWMFIGPINCGHSLGRITSVSTNPSNHAEIYAACEFGGLWKTTNGGSTWACLTDNNVLWGGSNQSISGIGVGCFDVDYSVTPHKIYASIGYPGAFYSAKFSYIYDQTRTFGLFYSFDDGADWNVVDGLWSSPLNINWIPSSGNDDVINDIKVHPTNPNLIFFSTQYLVARIDVTGMTSSSNAPSSMITLMDLHNFIPSTGLDSRTKGFGHMEFLPASTDDMFVTQNSIAGTQYSTTAKLFHIPGATLPTPGMPIDVTGNIPNAGTNIILDGTLTDPPAYGWMLGNVGGSTSSPVWQYTSPSGSIPGYMNFNNNSTSGAGSGCFALAISGDYQSTEYDVSFDLILPANTVLDVILRDPTDPYSNDCANPPTNDLNIYHNDNTCTSCSTITTTVTIHQPVGASSSTTDNFFSRLIFKGQTGSSYIYAGGSNNIQIANISIQIPYWDYINIATTPATGAGNILYVQPERNAPNLPYNGTYQFYNGQSYIDMFNGSTWLVGFTSSSTDNSPAELAIDALNMNVAYSGDVTGLNNCIDKFDLSAHVKTSGYSCLLHNDIRCLEVLPIVGSTTLEDLFGGDDGGLSQLTNFSSIAPGTVIDVTGGTPTTAKYAFSGSIDYSVSSSIHNGNIIAAAHDNAFLNSSQSNFNSWFQTFGTGFGGDGYSAGIGQRQPTWLMDFTAQNGGGTGGISISYGSNINSTPFQRIKTTQAGEYLIGTLYGSSHADIFSYDATTSHSFVNMTFGVSGWPTMNQIWSFQQDPSNQNYMIAYLNEDVYGNNFWNPGSGVFAITNNGGSTWRTTPNTTGTNFLDIAVDPRTNDPEKRIWVGGAWYSGHLGTGTNRVMLSTNGGTTFTDYSDGLPDGPVNTLVYDEQSHYLFAGTDVGVYARLVDNFHGQTADVSWQCFSMNLPNSFITDLDINRCTGKLYASTYGRGIWETELPPNWNWDDPSDPMSVDDITGTTPLVWNAQTKDQLKSIVIEPNATLIISGGSIINMARDKNITVKAGGALIVDNSTITNSCGSLWGCISVQGVGDGTTQNPPSSPLTLSAATGVDGIVVLRNGAIIENAYVGVHIGGQYYDGSDSPDYDYSTAATEDGGLVYADHTFFHNCVTGIKILPFAHTQNSTFTNCTIYADQYLHSNHYINGSGQRWGTVQGVWIGDWSGTTNIVNGVDFENCTFENNFSTNFSPTSDLWGTGISALNAAFHVNHCQFINLTRGIDMSNDGLTRDFLAPFVENTTFTNNWRCASFTDINSVVFQNNTANMTGSALSITGSSFDLSPVGVYYSQAQGAWIYKNAIGISGGTGIFSSYPKMCYGLVLNNTHNNPFSTTIYPFTAFSSTSPYSISSSTNTIYKNTISADAGIAAYQDNTGTQLLCNNLIGSNYRDISVWGTSTTPGLLDNQGSSSQPAGNRFQQPSGSCGTCSSTSSMFDIASSSVNPPSGFNYHEFTGTGSDPTFTAPCISCMSSTFTTVSVIADATTCATWGANCCNDLTFGPLYAPYVYKQTQDKITDINNYEYAIDSLGKSIDGGNTIDLLQAISSSTLTNNDLKKALSTVQYLSDTVLTALLTSSAKLLESVDLKPIILKNSKLSQHVWNVFAQQYLALSKDMDIINAQQSGPGIDDINLAVNKILQQRTVAINAVKDQYIRNDDWSSAATFLASKNMYEGAMGIYMHNNDVADARVMCSKISDPMVRFIDSFYIEHRVNGYKGRLSKNMHDSLTEGEQQVLTEIASNPYTRAGEIARIWLSAAKGEIIMEMMPKDTALNNTGIGSNFKSSTIQTGIIIFPNPAQDQITVLNQGSTWSNGTIVSAYDMSGRLMCRTLPTPKTNSLDINTQKWVPGTYLVYIMQPGQKEISQKVVIERK